MRKVCIIGLDRRTWGLFWEEPPGIEVWGLNQGHVLMSPEQLSRFTRWFQIHPWKAMAARQEAKHSHLEWLAQATIPVYLEELEPDVPSGVRYPYEEVCETLGGNYFAVNSFGYMIALAIHEGFKEIDLQGVDFGVTDRSDGYARPCIEFLLGLAMGRGSHVTVPEESALLKGDLYAKTVQVPSTAVEIALDALRGSTEQLPYVSQRLQLMDATQRVEAIYNQAMRNQARQTRQAGVLV